MRRLAAIYADHMSMDRIWGRHLVGNHERGVDRAPQVQRQWVRGGREVASLGRPRVVQFQAKINKSGILASPRKQITHRSDNYGAEHELTMSCPW